VHWWEGTYETNYPFTDKTVLVAPTEDSIWKNFKKRKILKIKKMD
jgi:hypothetical protein